MHQSNDYIKRNLRLSRAQKCIPLVGAISTLTCAGPQTTPTHVRQYRAENGILGKSGVPFAMVQCLHQSNDYMKRTLGLWRAQKCISLVGAISPLTCAGGSYRVILKMSKFPTCNTWGSFKSPVPRVTHGKRISHLSLTCPMCNTWGTYKSDLNSQ